MNAILLAGAALVGLPVLLHLIMKQEPKRLTFPAYRFLKQKLKTNQRKLRLKHFLLLALRMLIIALFCLTLFQPTIKSDQLNIRGEKPIAAVIIIDTSPSTAYLGQNGKSRLEEQRQRALEFLDELPDKSPVAVIDTADPSALWLPDLAAARRRIEELREPRGSSQSVSAALALAYQLHAKVEQETDAAEALQKVVAVFTDRAATSWEATRADDLNKLRETVPDPKPLHVLFDFGVDQPTNVGIVAAEARSQVIPANQPAVVEVSVGAVGTATETVSATVLAKRVGAPRGEEPLKQVVDLPRGGTGKATFTFRDLKVGVHQFEFSLAEQDNLAADNVRYLTLKVGAARRILTITDDPKAALFWRVAHAWKEEFDCPVVTPDQIKVNERGQTVAEFALDPKKPKELTTDDIRNFEVICLLAVGDPGQPAGNSLWDKLRPHLRAGGKLIVIPGRDTFTSIEGYNAATDLMPGKLTKVVQTRRMDPPPPKQTAAAWDDPRDGATGGVTWVFDEKTLKQKMLQPIEEWRQQKTDRVNILANPRRTKVFWEVTPDDKATVIARYRDSDKPELRRPAVLERPVFDAEGRARGKVVLVTTRLDVMDDDEDRRNPWNDFWAQEDSSWFVAFPHLLARYLAGDAAEAQFNFPVGASVAVPLARGKLTREGVIAFAGPGIVGNDAIIRPSDKQVELRFGPPRTNAAGNYALSITQNDAVAWKEGFSLNLPAEECNLAKVDVAELEKVLGEGRVVAVSKNVSLRELLSVSLGHPVDLFPWLLLAVLAALVAEGFIANRFYRRAK